MRTFSNYLSNSLIQKVVVCTGILIGLFLYAGSLSAQPNFDYDRPSLDPVDKNAGVHGGLVPTVWFWEKATNSNSGRLESAARRAQSIEADGFIPSMGFQLWNRTFELAQSGEYSDDPAFQAWVDWIEDRPHYLGRDRNDNLHYGNGWGYVSPLVRLDAKDVPPGFTGQTAYYADWQAYKVSTLAEAGATYGLFMSDFFDSHPSHGTSGVFDYFHPRMIDDFEAHSGITLASGSLAQQITDIRENHTQAWLEYFVDGWSYNWAALTDAVRTRTGKEPLIINQTSFTAAAMRRHGGVDPRVLLEQPEINPGNILFMSQALQPFVVKGVPLPESYEMIFTGIHAARTPDARIGQIISSEVGDFWKSVKKNWPNLNEERRTELGKKRLKRVWLASGWGHIAMPNGDTRRSAGHWERHYHDRGTIDQKVVELLQEVNPTKPFGPALYYSASIERKVEEEVGTGNTIVNGYLGEELHPATNITENGVPVAYFASDAIINNLNKINAPSAWIIPDRIEELPTEERHRLATVAPVLSGSEAINYQHPIRFSTSTSGRTVVGYAFYDQDERLIVVVGDRIKFGESNNSLPGITARIEIDLPGVADGQYTAENLQSDQSVSYSITNGKATLNIPIDRWDTRVLALGLRNSDSNQLQLTDISYRLRDVATGRYLDSSPDGLVSTKADNSDSAGRRWSFIDKGNGFYGIINSEVGRGLLGAEVNRKVSWQPETVPNSDDKLWKAVPVENNEYYLHNKQNGRGWLAASADGRAYWVYKQAEASRWALLPSTNINAMKTTTNTVKTTADAVDEPTVQSYPNPADHTVYLRGVSAQARIHLLGPDGQTLRKLTGSSFSVADLPPGLYLARITDGSQTITRRVLVK